MTSVTAWAITRRTADEPSLTLVAIYADAGHASLDALAIENGRDWIDVQPVAIFQAPQWADQGPAWEADDDFDVVVTDDA